MYKFTVLRKSGFGDYVFVVQRIRDLLGNQFEFVVINQKKYNNCHCKELDFLSLFYDGEYLDIDEEHIKTFKLKDVIERKVELDKPFCIEVDKEGFNLIQQNVIHEARSIFRYKPKRNPFGNLKNKFVIHIRISDLIIGNRLLRSIIDVSKLEGFLLTLNTNPMNCIICSDIEEQIADDAWWQSDKTLIKNIFYKVRDFNSKYINVVDRFIGKNKYLTISTMDAFHHCDKIISKSSGFAYIFNKPVIDVPNEYCFTNYEGLK